VVSLIGASGSGKSTFLRCLNHLETPTSGRIFIDGQPMGIRIDSKGRPRPDSHGNINRMRIDLGMVFQQFNLWPHMTVLGNVIEGPLRVRKMDPAQATEVALRYLKKVDLLSKKDEYPARLSGGQQQRVGIARALAMEPKVLLFDEPTSSLDPELTGEVLNVMRDLSREKRTMIVATHEMGFAQDASDRVLFLNGGAIEEDGPPDQVFRHPKSERCRQFLSSMRR
jgi:ABC-type histidine transport system ATPase subunit